MIWGLSEAAIIERRNGIGGSDARIVLHGTPEERYALWQEKVGEKKPSKIMSDWAAALRHTTEGLQLDWYEHVMPDHRVTRRGEVVISADYPFMRCTLDGFVEPLGVPINAKHISRWTKEAREWAIEHYTPQATHEAICLKADTGLLSLIHGEKEPEILSVEVDVFYRERMIAAERAFWHCVQTREPPPDTAELAVPKVAIEVKKLRRVEMPLFTDPGWQDFVQRNNFAVDLANEIMAFHDTRKAHNAHMVAREKIKDLLPSDVGELTRGPFTAKRSRANAITMTEED